MGERISTHRIPFEVGMHVVELPAKSELLYLSVIDANLLLSVLGEGDPVPATFYVATDGHFPIHPKLRSYIGSTNGPTGHVHLFMITQ